MGSRASLFKIENQSDLIAVENAVANIQAWTGIGNYALIDCYLEADCQIDFMDSEEKSKAKHYYAYVIHDGSVLPRTFHISAELEVFPFECVDENIIESHQKAREQKFAFKKDFVNEIGFDELLTKLPVSNSLNFYNVLLVDQGSEPKWKDSHENSGS